MVRESLKRRRTTACWVKSIMAATSAGRILTLCKQFHNVVRIPPSISAQQTALNVTKTQLYSVRQTSPLLGSSWRFHNGQIGLCRPLHTTTSRRGLEEFFDLPENWGESTVKSGDSWTAKQLRAKSNEDLHKLWYVLLKERNMLNTLEQESKRQRLPMPSPERLTKVQTSMNRMDRVVRERETALRLLQTGQEKERPGAWRKNLFGLTRWRRFREHPIPWYMNRHYKNRKFFTPSFVEPHIRLRMEKNMRARLREKSLKKKQQAKLQEKFPNMKSRALS